MVTHISNSPTETEAMGEAWGRTATSGLVIGLSGDLGAGKTCLVTGLARGLGCSARVHSPTFALLNIYRGGRLPLYHIDLYRLETREQIRAAGLEEYFRPEGVTVIEWAERWFGVGRSRQEVGGAAPADPCERGSLGIPKMAAAHLRLVTMETLGELQRRINYENIGP